MGCTGWASRLAWYSLKVLDGEADGGTLEVLPLLQRPLPPLRPGADGVVDGEEEEEVVVGNTWAKHTR